MLDHMRRVYEYHKIIVSCGYVLEVDIQRGGGGGVSLHCTEC